MDGLSAAIALKALDCLTARSEVTAENIANAQTPGYRPLRITFEQSLASAAAKGRGDIAAVTPVIEQSDEPGALRIDLEVATAASTAMRYAALVEVINRQLQLDGLVVSGKS